MRSKDCGMVSNNLSKTFSEEITLELFRRICLCRYFEWELKKVYDQGELIKMPIYLSIGQESIAAALSLALPNAYQFGQHRCHDLYLCYGGDPAKLIDELLHRPTGCAGGMGGSASIHSPETGMFGHDGLMGTQVPIAVGFALGSNQGTITIMGDASAEEDYVLSSLGFADSKKPPILFVCADNGLSILTKVETRRHWQITEIAKAFGLPAVEITDDPWLIMYHVNKLKENLPAFINIHTSRVLWHAGTGKDSEPEWDRFELIKEELRKLGLTSKTTEIENTVKKQVGELWQERLNASILASKRALDSPRERLWPPFDQKQLPPSPTTANTIEAITRQHLANGGVAMGQCLTAVGRVGRTVPELTEKDGLIELTMSDVAASGWATGLALAKRRPIYIVRYQGFQWFNAPMILNYAAKSKELWGIPCPVFIRSVAMDGAIGPVASGSHHSIYTRMPGITVCAPMTPKEYQQIWQYFLEHDDPMCVSEHRRSFKIDYEIPDQTYDKADITILAISATRLNVQEAITTLSKEGITCNLINLIWLKPFILEDRILEAIENSRYGGLLLDGDYENGIAKCLAYDLLQKISKPIHVLALEERTSGFAPHLDNLPPTAKKIVTTIKDIIK